MTKCAFTVLWVLVTIGCGGRSNVVVTVGSGQGGSGQDEPARPPDLVVQVQQTAPVDVVGEDGLTLIRRDPQGTTAVCTAPCRTTLVPGRYDFGVETPEGALAMFGRATLVPAEGLALRGEQIAATVLSTNAAR